MFPASLCYKLAFRRLEKLADFFFGDELQFVFADNGLSLVHIVGTEDEDSFSFVRKRIEVCDADASLTDGSYYVGSSAGDVVEFEREHIGESYCDASCL